MNNKLPSGNNNGFPSGNRNADPNGICGPLPQSGRQAKEGIKDFISSTVTAILTLLSYLNS